MTEIWKKVDGWDGVYEVSNFARVRSVDRRVATCGRKRNFTTRAVKGRVIGGYISGNGYRMVNLSSPEMGLKTRSIHRLTAIAFIPNPDNKPCINHIDCDRLNNSLDNLEWCTQKENMYHAVRMGRAVFWEGTEKGEKCPSSKLSAADVVEIKMKIRNGDRVKDIAENYPVGTSAIGEIKAGRSWGHIKI